MKIDNTTRTPLLDAEIAPAARDMKTALSARQLGHSPQDHVTLSLASSHMQDLIAQVQADNGFNATRVNAVKQAISEGRFTINPETIADKLIASTRELLPQKR